MNDLKVDFLYICHRKSPVGLTGIKVLLKKNYIIAQVVKLVDTLVSGTNVLKL